MQTNRLGLWRWVLGGLSLLPGGMLGIDFDWQVVVNNSFVVPGDSRRFNSYNQPSVNVDRLVVFRARSKGGASGEPAHGVYTRDMALAGDPVNRVFDRDTLVFPPNNLGTKFKEPPSFPRIDMTSDTVASRGNHAPVWEYSIGPGLTTRGGTTGIYVSPFGLPVTGGSNLGHAPGFEVFAVPGLGGTRFEVFPGAPAVTDSATIVFKGNSTLGTQARTGVYFRDLTDAEAGGLAPAVVIADTDTHIPGSRVHFGSTAPPSAAGRRAVFAGFDDEENPGLGGIFLAPLTHPRPPLTPLVAIGDPVPGEARGVFNRLGEGVSFDGRFVAFWGAWDVSTRSLLLICPDEGNKARLEYCREQYPDGFATTVPKHQGIFVHDSVSGRTWAIARAPEDFDDFVYWNFSGMVPGMSESEDSGEPARWRSASFVAVSGLVDGELTDKGFHVAFKARTGALVDGVYVAPIDGIYLGTGPHAQPPVTLLESGMPGTRIDPAAIAVDAGTGVATPLPVTSMGVERDGFRGDAIAVNVAMGSEEAGWAGIYLATVPEDLSAGMIFADGFESNDTGAWSATAI